MSGSKKFVVTKAVAASKLRRIALQIVEQNYSATELVVIGIKGSGSVVAASIAAYLQQVFSGNIVLAELSLNKQHPGEVTIKPAVDCHNKVVILVDDVANSGRTMLYALQPLLQAYPAKVQTAALVERTHKSFPIALDYVGLSISTSLNEHIFVEVSAEEVLGAWMEG